MLYNNDIYGRIINREDKVNIDDDYGKGVTYEY